MSASELCLTVVVALAVFGPKKLPMLAQHLGQLIAKGQYYRQQALALMQSHINEQRNEQRLEENRKQAQKVDASYPKDSAPDSSSRT